MRSGTTQIPLILGLAFAALAARGADAAADIIVVNGNVLTVDANFSRASAVAIKDGVFAAIGSDA